MVEIPTAVDPVAVDLVSSDLVALCPEYLLLLALVGLAASGVGYLGLR